MVIDRDMIRSQGIKRRIHSFHNNHQLNNTLQHSHIAIYHQGRVTFQVSNNVSDKPSKATSTNDSRARAESYINTMPSSNPYTGRSTTDGSAGLIVPSSSGTTISGPQNAAQREALARLEGRIPPSTTSTAGGTSGPQNAAQRAALAQLDGRTDPSGVQLVIRGVH